MVKALLNGTKTQTRRIVRAPKCATVHGRVSYPDKHFSDASFRKHGPLDYLHWAYGGGDHGKDVLYSREMCPYGDPAWVCGDTTHEPDRLWVRETWTDLTETSGTPWERFNPETKCYERGRNRFVWYRADGEQPGVGDCVSTTEPWRPSIFMKRCDSRITLEITDVRVERVQSITEDDARAEGVDNGPGRGGHLYPSPRAARGPLGYREVFHELWDKINGKRAAWASNPWVWAITFRRLTP